MTFGEYVKENPRRAAQVESVATLNNEIPIYSVSNTDDGNEVIVYAANTTFYAKFNGDLIVGIESKLARTLRQQTALN